MECAIEMQCSLTLADLPPDVIRLIIRMEGESEAAMCLISHTWNALAKQYFIEHPLSVPLERLHLCSGIDDVKKLMVKHPEDASRNTLTMHAIIPHFFAAKAGLGKWLNVYDRHSGSMLEAVSLPQQVAALHEAKGAIISLKLLLIVAICAFLYGPAFVSVPVFILFCSAVVLLGFSQYKMVRKTKKNRWRFLRFFKLFSHVKTMVLENFVENERVLKDARIMLTGVRINTLVFKDSQVNVKVKEEIVEICRECKVENVHIITSSVYGIGFRTFFTELCKLGVTVDIYDVGVRELDHAFNRPLHTWRTFAYQLHMMHGLSLQILDTDQVSRSGYHHHVSAHLRCTKTVENAVLQPLRPLIPTRGYWVGSVPRQNRLPMFNVVP